MSFNIKIVDKNLDSNIKGFEVLSDFEVKLNLLAQVLRSEMLNLRSGNAHSKTRSEVSGGGRKPWKQKGTGRARHGSTRSPIWVGGGVTHGPRNQRNWFRKINKSSRLSALKSLVKDRLQNESVFQLNQNFDLGKTKDALQTIDLLKQKNSYSEKKILFIYSPEDKDKLRGICNVNVKKINVENLKLTTLANGYLYIFTPSSKEFLENRFKN
jgi:large subunit ribosomal protein L4